MGHLNGILAGLNFNRIGWVAQKLKGHLVFLLGIKCVVHNKKDHPAAVKVYTEMQSVRSTVPYIFTTEVLRGPQFASGECQNRHQLDPKKKSDETIRPLYNIVAYNGTQYISLFYCTAD